MLQRSAAPIFLKIISSSLRNLSKTFMVLLKKIIFTFQCFTSLMKKWTPYQARNLIATGVTINLLKSSSQSNSSTLSRSSRPEVFCKKGVFRNFVKFTRKHLRQSLFFSKVGGLRSATLLKKRLWHRCFPVNFAKSLRTPFLAEHLRCLLLVIPNVSMPIDIFLK